MNIMMLIILLFFLIIFILIILKIFKKIVSFKRTYLLKKVFKSRFGEEKGKKLFSFFKNIGKI